MSAESVNITMGEIEKDHGQAGSDGMMSGGAPGYEEFREKIEDQENRYRILVQNIQEYIYIVNYADGILTSTYHSDKSLEVTGYTADEYGRNPSLWFSMIHVEDRTTVNEFLGRVLSSGGSGTIEHRIINKDGLVRWVSNTCSAVTGRDGRLEHLIGFVLDITKSKKAEMSRGLAIRVLERLNRSGEIRDIIKEIITMVKDHLGIEAVGIRLIKDDDYPFYVTDGYPDYFVEAENSLLMHDSQGLPVCDQNGNPALACLCGIVVTERTVCGRSHFTPRGSFWTNNAIDADIAAVLDRGKVHLRPRCISEGYESIALIPLKSEDRTIGLLQMNDRRKGFFTPETIEFFEGIGASIGVALSRKMAEEALQTSEEKLRQRAEAVDKELKLARLVQNIFLVNRSNRATG